MRTGNCKARCYVVPFSHFAWGNIGRAIEWECEKTRLLQRREQLEKELAAIGPRLADADAKIAEFSLEQWRVDHGRQV